MIFRKTQHNDLKYIIWMANDAKKYFREHNIDQWQNGYPDEHSFEEDRKQGVSYVLEENGIAIATMALIFDGEPTYDTIYEGSWLTAKEASYAAIHRIIVAPDKKGQGLAGRLIQEAEALIRKSDRKNIKSIRNDTHEDNQSMQRMLEKNGFVRCGIIYLEDGAKRVAFEKQLR